MSTLFLPADMKVLSGDTDNQGACSLAVENTDSKPIQSSVKLLSVSKADVVGID